MAKSLRSKWRRKMRSERREKFGKKTLETLKKTVMKPKSEKSKDKKIISLYTVKTPKEINKMEGKDVDSKTMRDEHGTFPVWMHPRKKRKLIKQGKRSKVKKDRDLGKKKGGEF